jgi:hypothetical protein
MPTHLSVPERHGVAPQKRPCVLRRSIEKLGRAVPESSPSPRVVPRRGRQQRQHTTTDRCGGAGRSTVTSACLVWRTIDREGGKKSRRRGGSSATLHRPKLPSVSLSCRVLRCVRCAAARTKRAGTERMRNSAGYASTYAASHELAYLCRKTIADNQTVAPYSRWQHKFL